MIIESLSNKELKKLITRYKKEFPIFEPKWIEINENSIQESQNKGYLDHCSEYFKQGVVVYRLNLSVLWKMIYKPEECYTGRHLWSSKHDKDKIAEVLYDWAERKIYLSPITVVCHLSIPRLLISDGNHRFSVLRYLSEKTEKDYEVLIAVNAETSQLIEKYADKLNLNVFEIYPNL